MVWFMFQNVVWLQNPVQRAFDPHGGDKILLDRLKLELANNDGAHSRWRSAAGSETSRSEMVSEPAGQAVKARWIANVAAAGFQHSRAPAAPSHPRPMSFPALPSHLDLRWQRNEADWLPVARKS